MSQLSINILETINMTSNSIAALTNHEPLIHTPILTAESLPYVQIAYSEIPVPSKDILGWRFTPQMFLHLNNKFPEFSKALFAASGFSDRAPP